MSDPRWLVEDINSLAAELIHLDDLGVPHAGVHNALRRAHRHIEELRNEVRQQRDLWTVYDHQPAADTADRLTAFLASDTPSEVT